MAEDYPQGLQPLREDRLRAILESSTDGYWEYHTGHGGVAGQQSAL